MPDSLIKEKPDQFRSWTLTLNRKFPDATQAERLAAHRLAATPEFYQGMLAEAARGRP
jgi:hypothetical protein